MKHEIKGKGVPMQRDTKTTNGKALPKDKLRLNEGLRKIIGKKKCEIKDCLTSSNLILHEGWCDLNLIKDFVLMGLDNKTL